MTKTLSVLCLLAATLSACSSDPYQGVYEGIKAQNEAKRTPQERAMNPAPSYDEYKKARTQDTPATP